MDTVIIVAATSSEIVEAANSWFAFVSTWSLVWYFVKILWIMGVTCMFLSWFLEQLSLESKSNGV